MLDDITVSVNGGPEHDFGSAEADEAIVDAASRAMSLPGMHAPRRLVRAGRDIDTVKFVVKGSSGSTQGPSARVAALADTLRLEEHGTYTAAFTVVGENVAAKETQDGTEYVLTITLELAVGLHGLEAAAGIADEA